MKTTRTYNHEDYMPKAEGFPHAAGLSETPEPQEAPEPAESIEPEQTEPTESEPEREQKQPVAPPEPSRTESEPRSSAREDVAATATPVWARYVSAFFSPLLIPTYCVALAMWLTPLSHLSEHTRLMATLAILGMTAVIPTACMATLMRLGRRTSDRVARPAYDESHRLAPALLFVVCQGIGAYYLYSLYAPNWLTMILVAGATTTLVLVGLNFFSSPSAHAAGMGTLCAIALYLGRKGLSEVQMTPWVIAFVLLSGVVCSARLALRRHTIAQMGWGYAVGLVVTFVMMYLTFFASRTVPLPE